MPIGTVLEIVLPGPRDHLALEAGGTDFSSYRRRRPLAPQGGACHGWAWTTGSVVNESKPLQILPPAPRDPCRAVPVRIISIWSLQPHQSGQSWSWSWFSVALYDSPRTRSNQPFPAHGGLCASTSFLQTGVLRTRGEPLTSLGGAAPFFLEG